MLFIKLEELRSDPELKEKIIDYIQDDMIFLYPTDTIYGLGCNANSVSTVRKIRNLKGTGHPFSIIAPSVDWIKENFIVKFPEYLDRLPGPYTLIVNKKDPNFMPWVSENGSMGVRIPHHHFTKFVQKGGVPFVTTSANISGYPHIKNVNELPDSLLKSVDVIVDADSLHNPPSIIIDLTGSEPMIIRG